MTATEFLATDLASLADELVDAGAAADADVGERLLKAAGGVISGWLGASVDVQPDEMFETAAIRVASYLGASPASNVAEYRAGGLSVRTHPGAVAALRNSGAMDILRAYKVRRAAVL